MDGAVSCLWMLTILLVLSSASADVCFWSGLCTNIWLGGCGVGRFKVDHSDDCNGVCPPPRYPPCPPFATHVLCCNEETPIPSDECARFTNRVDVGDHWMCCSDGSEARVSNRDLRTGFCRTGSQLSIQVKTPEVFKWMPREWSECPESCGEGVKKRVVHCVGKLDHSPQLYYVNETKCDPTRKPRTEKSCRARHCPYEVDVHYESHGREHHRRHRLPIWARLMIFVLTSIGIAGVSVGGYMLYQRWKERNDNHGFVYVMLDNYA